MNLITWLRRFSIRSRLITCMVLVVGIGSIVGSGMSWQLWSLKGEFDAFTQQEFAAVQRMGKLALNLSALRGHERPPSSMRATQSRPRPSSRPGKRR